MSVRIASHQQISWNRLQLGLKQHVYMLHFPQTRCYVPMVIPKQQAGKHNCIRPSGIYVTVAPDQQPCPYKLYTIGIPVCYSFILSASMSISFASSTMPIISSSDHLPCLSQLHLTSSHVCLTCAYKHACLIQLYWTRFIFVIAISNHL